MKGFWRTMESVLAALIIMSFLATAGNVYLANTGDGEPASNGYEKLKELDALGELRPLAAAKDYAAISSIIDVPGYNRSVMICDFSGNCWGNYTAAQLESGNVLASTYIISGHASYEPLEIRLYMWR